MWLEVVVVSCAAVTVCAQALAVGESMDEFRRDALDLNGRWECLLEAGEQEMWRPEVAAGQTGWKNVRVPNQFLPRLGVERGDFAKVQSVWARRRFKLTAEQARRGAVLKWGGVRFGATAWLNGRPIGSHPVMGPHAMLLPDGALKPGRNELLMKIPGWAGIPKSRSGYPLIPTGSGTQGWGHKGPAIYDDIWLEFHDGAYLNRVLAVPDVKASRVTFRVELDGTGALPEKIELSAAVRALGAATPIGSGTATAGDARRSVELTVPLRGAKPWTPAEPNLHEAELTARAGGRLCDRVRVRFGLREVRVRRGRYELNGRPLWLRGSNLVFEWQWGGPEGQFNRNVKRYIVDEARQMNLNSFRTHTIPPPAGWLDVADRHGTMIWAELPVLYNYGHFRFRPEEWEVFHKHALLDATGWVTKLWNHPSVVIWVLSNESPDDNAWESGPFHRHVKRLDPTRPTLRSGGPQGTPDTFDVHTCGNYGGPAEGSVLPRLAKLAADKDPARPLSNSEYMNVFGQPRRYALRWLGEEDTSGLPLVFAEFAAEHTEAMRRLRYDGILPYMYAGWSGLREGNRWRKDYPCPMAAALHSVMAPVLVSLDLFDRNFPAGREVATRAVLINELHEDVRATLDLYLTPADPVFVPDPAALETAVWREGHKLTFPADSFAEKTLRWKVPAQEGAYYLAAVLRRSGDRPVVSQRVVRSIRPPDAPAADGPKVLLLGATAAAEKWLKARGLPYVTSLKAGKPAGGVAVVWDEGRLSKDARSAGKALRRFAAGGRRVVVLGPRRWDWSELADFKLHAAVGSRAFPYAGAKHPVLSGIDPQWLRRFNGIPGTVAERYIDPADAGATRLLWIDTPDRPVLVALPVGKGEILLCTLNLKSRLAPSGPNHDPAAERIVWALLHARPAPR